MSRFVFRDIFLSFDIQHEKHYAMLKNYTSRVIELINSSAEILTVHYTPECRSGKHFLKIFEGINLPTDAGEVKMDLEFTRESKLDGSTIKATSTALKTNLGIRRIFLPGYRKAVINSCISSDRPSPFTLKRVKEHRDLSSYFRGFVKITTSQGVEREVYFGTDTPRSCLLAATSPDNKPAHIHTLRISGNDRLTLMNLGEQFQRMGQTGVKANVDELVIRDMSFVQFDHTAIKLPKVEKLSLLNCLGAPKGFLEQLLVDCVGLKHFTYEGAWDHLTHDHSPLGWDVINAGRKAKGAVDLNVLVIP